jgi:membrane-bound metal-dependent hydrolase YbcI (DUF457 family)
MTGMKRDEHLIIGFFIAILGGVVGQNFTEYFDFILYVLFISLILFGSIFPDLIEHPRSADHRKFFHSITILGILVILLILLNIGNQYMLTYLSSGFLIGYLSHLLLDATSRVRLLKY